MSTNAHLWRSIDPAFDDIILAMAEQLMPEGFDTSENAPSTLEELLAHMSAKQRMCVWSGASGYTIYGSPDVNFAFRAWHDWCHWQGHLPFDFLGEAAACDMQCRQLMERYGDSTATRRYRTYIFAEVMGQTAYRQFHDIFPSNQRRFVIDLVRSIHERGADTLR